MHQQLLIVHIALGFLSLLLGAIAMVAPKRRGIHTLAGESYHWVVLAVCVTAVVLAVWDWAALWWFVPIACGSYAFALLGYLAAKVRWRGWLQWHVSGQGGSYIAMVTAFLVVNWQTLSGSSGIYSPLAWAIPTLVGSPIIAWTNFRLRQREILAGTRP